MQEISLNVLDIAQNSISAGARLVTISAREDTPASLLTITIADDGRGMTPEQVEHVTDPFYTTRTTRRVGLGVPFFKMASEMTGGEFTIDSQPGKGTVVRAVFHTDHIDCMPLGDLEETIFTLVTLNPGIDFRYEREVDGATAVLDTREFREILGDVPLNAPEVTQFIRDYLNENFPHAGQQAKG